MITIGKHSYSAGIVKGGLSSVTIGNFCSIGENVVFDAGMQHNLKNITTSPLNQLFPDVMGLEGRHPITKGNIVIKNDVWISEGCFIMGNTQISDGAVVGARSVVTKNIPPYEVWAGTPAKFIRKRFTDEQIEKLLTLSWWHWDESKIKENAHLIMSEDVENFLTLHCK
jgi:acetyltransferase-like isoleucine patch superfamily enzyme